MGFAFWLCLEGTAYAAGHIKVLKVVVECNGENSIGPRVCFALKEKIRASEGFELISTDSPGSFKVSLVSIQTDESDEAIAISEDITLRAVAGYDIQITHAVVICGTRAVDSVADGIIADLEQQSDFFR